MKGLMSVLRWFGHVERMERDRIAKSAYVGEYAGSHSVGRLRKRWIDTVKDCLRKSGLDVRQARRMMESLGSIVGGSGCPCSLSFLFYVNVSGMRKRSCLSSQPLVAQDPYVLLRVRWSIPWFIGSTLGNFLPFPCWE